MVELFGVDHDAAGAQRHCAAGEPGAGSARNYFESEPRNGQQQRRHLLFIVGRNHGQRQVQAPVGGIGGVRDQGEGIEENVVPADDAGQFALDPIAQLGRLFDLGAEGGKQRAASCQNVQYARIAFRLGGNRLQVLGGIFKEALAARSRGHQFLIEVRIAAMNQHLAEQAHEDARRAAGYACAAQLVEGADGLGAEQKRNRLPVSGGGVVEWNLADGREPPRRLD